MKIKISNTYQIAVNLKAEKELDLAPLILWLWSGAHKIKNKSDLKWEIYEYLSEIDAFNNLYVHKNEDIVEDSEVSFVENMDELIEYFKDLIKDV